MTTTLESLYREREELLAQLNDNTDPIFEKALMEIPGWETEIKKATSFQDIAKVFKIIFDEYGVEIPGQKAPETPTDYANENTPFGLKKSGQKYREKINAQCKEILKRVEKPEDLTPEDREILVQYSGRGATTEGSFFEYYTPPGVAEGVWDMLKAHGFENGNVLEPATGSGVFSATKPEGAIITGAEISETSAKINALLHPDDHIENKPFEQLVMETPDNTFDGVVTNVPFGDVRGATKHIDPDFKNIRMLDQYFLLRMIDKLKPGKLACIICPSSTVGRKADDRDKYGKFRVMMSKKAEFLGAHKFPSKTFQQYGTTAVIDVVVFRKHPQDLLDKIPDLPWETLKEANVIWDPFISGEYWKTAEGKKNIMGKWIPKGLENNRREIVDGDIDNASIKQKLAQRFHSRINWDLLESAEPIHKNYVNGDRTVIGGVEHEYQDGQWIKQIPTAPETVSLDKEKYGAENLAELESLLSDTIGGLSLTSEQMWAVFKDYKHILSPLQIHAVEFAMSQSRPELAEQLYRGSIIGGMIAGYQNAVNDPLVDADEAERDVLNELVVAEISKYGHPLNNPKLTMTGESARYFGLFANAYDKNGTPNDLLAGTLLESSNRLLFDTTDMHSIVEQLYTRDGITTIELDDIKKLYTGKRKIEALGDIADIEGIAITEAGTIEPFHRATCGDIYFKINALTTAMMDEKDDRLKDKWQKQIDEMLRKRKTTDPEDITFGFQQKWIPKQYIIEFLHENGYDDIQYGRYEDFERMDSWTGEMVTDKKFVVDHDTPFGEFIWKNGKPAKFDLHFLSFLNGKKMSGKAVKDQNGKVIEGAPGSVEDNKRILKDMEDNFNVFLKQHADIDEIGERYNQKFNNFVPFEYPGDDLKLDISDRFTLHSFQNSAIRQMSEEGRGCIALDVGLGKTVTALGLCEYNRKMGRSKKSCIVVPKAVLGNWYQESKAFLGHHNNVLFVGFEPKRGKDGKIETEALYEADGSPKMGKDGKPIVQDVLVEDDFDAIYKKMWSIPQTNHSIVVMTKERFGQIPLKPSTKLAYADKMVEKQLISEASAKESVADSDMDKDEVKKMSYEEHRAKIRKEGNLSDDGTKKRQELPYYEDMGFDSVVVDEAHEFKNLYVPKNETNIAYLSTPMTAQRSMDMAMKTSFLRDTNNGRGVYELTATPVTNSAFETYTMLSYICGHEEFEKYDIHTVDDFIRTFGIVENVSKVNMAGEAKGQDALVGFKNMDGLRSILNKYVLLKTANDYPEQIKLPPADEQYQEVELMEGQQAIYDQLRKEAKEAYKKMGRTQGKSKGDMLKVLRKMDRLTTDLDMYFKAMTFTFKADQYEAVKKLITSMPATIKVTRYEKQNPDDPSEKAKAVKVDMAFSFQVFDDKWNTVVEKGESADEIPAPTGDTFMLTIPEEFESAFTNRFKPNKVDEREVSHPVMPKYAKLIENLKSEHEQNGKQIIFTEEKSQHNKIKRIITHHMPIEPALVNIINADTAGGEKLQEISDLYNSGKVKIVIANKKAEVGVNLQKGTTAIHHLTFPWTPASIQQRNGRGVRQGNTAKRINIYYYHGKDSIDGYRLDMLKGKGNWIHALFFGEGNTMENEAAHQGDDIEIMLAENKDEARKKIMEQREKQAQKKIEDEKKRALNTLQQIISQRAALEQLETKRELEKDKLNEKIETLKEKIADFKSRIKDTDDDEKIGKLSKSIAKHESDLEKAQKRLGGIDTVFDKKKASLESGIKQKTGQLRAKARKEGLPFNEKILDDPDSAVVGLDGTVFTAGDVFEIKGAKNEDWNGTVFKVTDVDTADKLINIEPIVTPAGGRMRTNNISIKMFKGILSRASYSEKELNFKKMLAKEWTYEDLCKGELDKDTFYENLDQIRFKDSYYNNVVVYKEGTGYDFQGVDNLGEGQDYQKEHIVYPDTNNEGFRKGVCEYYLTMKRAGGTSHSVDMTMQSIFGNNYDSIASEYGQKATKTDVLEACARVWDEIYNDYAERIGLDSVESLEMALSYNGIVSKASRNISGEVMQLGDNEDEISEFATEFLNIKRDEIQAKITKLKADAEKKKLEEIKNHPDFKEVPKDIERAFSGMGITVKTNMESLVVRGKGRYSDRRFEPFQNWFFQDEAGKNGKLYNVKDILKARYGASFFFNNSGDNFNGAWWYLPAKHSLKELYELIV